MTGFEPWTSCIGTDHFANLALFGLIFCSYDWAQVAKVKHELESNKMGKTSFYVEANSTWLKQ